MPRPPIGLPTARRAPPIALALLVTLAAAVAVALAAGGGSRAPVHASAEAEGPGSASLAGAPTGAALRDPIDPRFLTSLRFGQSSFWLQPWRAYMDTWPASRLLDSLGINFDVKPPEADAVAHLLHDSGFTLARIGINWSSLSYADPSRFADEAGLNERLDALRRYGLRPLILLDANSVKPTPESPLTLRLAQPAPAGATQVRLDPASAAGVVAGRTGFDSSAFHAGPGHRKRHGPHRKRTPAEKLARREERRAAAGRGLTRLVLSGNPAILIARVGPGGLATLSRPLPIELPAGAYKGDTLLYAPFATPTLADGRPNPAFEQTLSGWLRYVATVCRKASSVFGPGGYDVEVWNEPTFGSQFLDAGRYSGAGGGEGRAFKEVAKALLDETVAFVRDPANGISAAVGISDGFASQTPFPSSASAPVGLTALSKHLYDNVKSFPAEFKLTRANVPLNAFGARDTTGSLRSDATPEALFVPHFQSLFPEYFLTALQTATVVRDIAPITTRIYREPHGRDVGAAHGKPVQVWMTEYNLNPSKGTIVGPDGIAPVPSAALTPADKRHFQAKALLRSLVAMIGKGMTREYFFHAGPGALGMIDERFAQALSGKPGAYPGDALGGETMTSFRNLLGRFDGPGPDGRPRTLGLASIAQDGDHAQFKGDGSTAHPSLYDREVLAVLPFQSSPTRFVIPVYVMTRDLLTLYRPNAPQDDLSRFDLPDETFRIALTGLPTSATPPTVTAYDPIHDRATPARLIDQTGGTARIEIAATDYPRVLTISYPAR